MIDKYNNTPIYILYWVHLRSDYKISNWTSIVGTFDNDGAIHKAIKIIDRYKISGKK